MSGFFGSQKTQGFFRGTVFFISPEINNNIRTVHTKKVGIFFGRQILKMGLFLGIKYEPLFDPPNH